MASSKHAMSNTEKYRASKFSSTAPAIDPEELARFRVHLERSTRILALLGAGLSASSGLPTFRGAGGLWRKWNATDLATPEAFADDPGLVWQFYSYRRHMSLNAKPNRAHLALAELARQRPNFITLSQNVDGLSPRAGHPHAQLKLLHGSLFDVKCWDEEKCKYKRENDFVDPIVPVLALPQDYEQAAEESVSKGTVQRALASGSQRLDAAIAKKHALINGKDISDASVPIPEIKREQLPQCPQCQKELLRPGVVWFGESLPHDVMAEVNAFVYAPEKIDLMLVIGTSSAVYPAAGYTEIARDKGARVAVINMDENDAKGMRNGDWFFKGDAAEIVPEILKSIVGETPHFGEAGSKADQTTETAPALPAL